MTFISPLFATGASSHALSFAWNHLTKEGFCTILALLIVSIFSWTVIISKARQLIRARRTSKKFYEAYRATRDPMDIFRKNEEFDGAPAYELYRTGAEEADYHLKNNPVIIESVRSLVSGIATQAHTDMIARSITTKISHASFDSVRVAMERAASDEALALEKGMIILSTAVAGGPFIGLFGTVWGVMETFSGIGIANAASLNAMPAMFAYNYMVTTIRAITQELDSFSNEYATQLEHKYVDNRAIADEIRNAFKADSRGRPSQPPAKNN
jgi:biopolymer transport protein TolQ